MLTEKKKDISVFTEVAEQTMETSFFAFWQRREAGILF